MSMETIVIHCNIFFSYASIIIILKDV